MFCYGPFLWPWDYIYDEYLQSGVAPSVVLSVYVTDNRKSPWRARQANDGYSRRVYEPFYCDSLYWALGKKKWWAGRGHRFSAINWQVITRTSLMPAGKNFLLCSFRDVSTCRGNIRQPEVSLTNVTFARFFFFFFLNFISRYRWRKRDLAIRAALVESLNCATVISLVISRRM